MKDLGVIMKFVQHYSSSRGNLYVVEAANGCRLLLECGVRWPVLQKALQYNFDGLEGCLLTHEHKDHSQATEDLIKAGIDVYASEGTFDAIEPSLSLTRRANVCDDGTIIKTESFFIFPFVMIHDAAQPLGYIVHEKDAQEYLLFCPDSAFLRQTFGIKFTIVALECSYDKAILQNRVDAGDIHEEVAKRIAGSHAEKDTTLKYLQNCCDLSRCRQIHLIHTSGVNLNKRAVKEEFKRKLFMEIIIK
jgi:phosphoribosyl 1,2-cyclic phosphodiesterase